MPIPLLLRQASVAAWTLTMAAAVARSAPRDWKHEDGRTVQGTLIGVERGRAMLVGANGRQAAVELENLSAEDRRWIDEWESGRKPEDVLPPITWPAAVTQPLPRIEGPAPENGGSVFRTVHYRFVADAELSTSAVQDFATVAEATWKLLEAWPLPPSEKSRALLEVRIFRRRDEYQSAGGPPETAGVFMGSFGSSGALLVPFESLGIEAFQGRFTKGAAYHPRVLIHEMTHQIYAPLIRLLPLWLNEGLAEYIALIPYKNGTFHLGRAAIITALRQRIEDHRLRDPGRTGVFGSKDAPAETWTMPLTQLFQIDDADPGLRQGSLLEKHRAYFTSLLVVFYLLHFDGDSQARGLRLCLDQVAELQRRRRGRSSAASLPQGWTPADASSLGRIREKVTAQLRGERQTGAFETEIRKKFAGLGVKIDFHPEGSEISN
ncbi:MAG: hypothetical protein ACR2OZ_04790 [Verrucomicrobiales bacterium]